MTVFEHRPHPWIALRRAGRPPRVADEHIGFNGRVAAWLTKRLGSMWVVYFVTVFSLGWMALAQLGPLSADRYPFPFLLFMGNVVQVLLIFVIMVGQQVLGGAADKRAAQTYKDAEAILHECMQLQAHLEAQDKLLAEGAKLFDVAPPERLKMLREGQPPKTEDHYIGINGRIAAFLTQKIGTMWAFYISAVVMAAWIAANTIGVAVFDPYPFAFLLFIASLVQLILMFVLMVGQDVLGMAADHRAVETYRDAEAVLAETQQLQAHLRAQDEVLERLVDHLRAVNDGRTAPTESTGAAQA